MRDWRNFWRQRAAVGDSDLATELSEVGKTVLGQPISEAQLGAIVASICEALNLTGDDEVADLGCGNGLITARVFPHVRKLAAFDISEALISAALSRHNSDGLIYETADICSLMFSSAALRNVRKVYLYEVAQHLTTDEFATVLSNAFGGGRVEILFSGSMPDADRLENFYDTPERMALYRRNVAANTEQIGHWWHLSEIQEIVSRIGLRMEVRHQNPILHTAHYRFDVLFHG